VSSPEITGTGYPESLCSRYPHQRRHERGTMNRAWQQAMPLLLQPVTKN